MVALCVRLAWGEELLSMPPTAEEYSPTTSQVLFRGLSARLGIASGLVLQPRPNIQTGAFSLLLAMAMQSNKGLSGVK